MSVIKFDTLEELKEKYPINEIDNKYWELNFTYENFYTQEELYELIKVYPDGIVDKEDRQYWFFKINEWSWYDSYIYNNGWYLAKDSWDGYQYAKEPKYNQIDDYMKLRLTYIFKTKQEAVNFAKKYTDITIF